MTMLGVLLLSLTVLLLLAVGWVIFTCCRGYGGKYVFYVRSSDFCSSFMVNR